MSENPVVVLGGFALTILVLVGLAMMIGAAGMLGGVVFTIILVVALAKD